MRYKVPQKIDMEDKIVGPLTLNQFLIVMVGGMIVYALYHVFFLEQPIIFWILATPVGLVATSFAFVRVQEEPLPRFLVFALMYLTRAKQRVWMKEGQTGFGGKIFIEEKKTIVKQKIDTKQESRAKIDNSIAILDR